tara:strand:- start:600 stop:881 length:282 start_codon:yes stop_codon:yes gene_type:complete
MIIKNPAVQPSDEFNEMTYFFKGQLIEDWPNRVREYWVVLRNGLRVRPAFHPAYDEHCKDCFIATVGEQRHCWNLDGTSVTRSAYDMMRVIVE